MKEKKIFLVRHAKAEEHSFIKKDYNRNLITKGIQRAKRIASQLLGKITFNEHTIVISSSANRALQTAQIFSEELDYPVDTIIQTKAIYEAHYSTILEVINQVPANIDTLVIFGHNPGLSDLANYVCNTYINLNTSAVAEIIMEEGLDFADLSSNTATLREVLAE